MFTLNDIINLAIRIEKNGEETYRKAQEEVSNPSLASMLKWLAEEEVEHEKWFTQLKEKVATVTDDPRLEEMLFEDDSESDAENEQDRFSEIWSNI